ncbi:hypothetical protein [Candidatus Uabimicrobium amorphum]|uniref:Uncharacterized protein n=1 Tax=Uabimicrobium amorphum TaxID=2596890 RepID=A0A5S9F7Y8_UABAM|nr:hypothetical protein [Candidatus Uabimicrobium amorphum]BBM88239.1 hypothetical protein UABAM_06660 [Candidatus Uabimicrobium amorphum]
MKNIVILVVLLTAVSTFADINRLQDAHKDYMLYFGDADFLQGKNEFVAVKRGKEVQAMSVFKTENGFCTLQMNGDSGEYITCKATQEDNVLSISFVNRKLTGRNAKTVAYKIEVKLEKDNFAMSLSLDKSLTDAAPDFWKVLQCVGQYAPHLIGAIQKCKDSGDFIQCVLDLIDPASNLFKCIFGGGQAK